MNTQDVATDLTALCKAGDFTTPGEKYWADDVVSIEAAGPDPVSRGKEAARGKGQWWAGAHEVHSVQVDGPFVNGDQFTVRFKLDVTQRESGHRFVMDEIALYTVKDGKITEERFFYNG
jgi:ketosteroid isomerase-like protein